MVTSEIPINKSNKPCGYEEGKLLNDLLYLYEKKKLNPETIQKLKKGVLTNELLKIIKEEIEHYSLWDKCGDVYYNVCKIIKD